MEKHPRKITSILPLSLFLAAMLVAVFPGCQSAEKNEGRYIGPGIRFYGEQLPEKVFNRYLTTAAYT